MTTPAFVARIDLRSDTVTRPTPAMREAIASADVGDDVLDGDPTVRRLEARVAELLGTERALFFPSGTMANQTAIYVLAERGTEIFVDATSHVLDWELAGAAALAGVQARAVRPHAGDRPMNAASLSAAIRPDVRASLVCLENTHGASGGSVVTIDEMRAVADVARAHGLPVHLDGARLWNAAVALGCSEAAIAACADTTMVSFSKGLGAPVGAALAGTATVIERARIARKRFGGGMRQAGVLAAGALYGVEHHRAALGEDHRRARALAARLTEALGTTAGVDVVAPETNMVMIDVPAGMAAHVVSRAARDAVLVGEWSATRVRCVTHLDVTDADIERAAAVVAASVAAAVRDDDTGVSARRDARLR